MGILLAAGRSQRFGTDKRMAILPDGRRMIDASIAHALQALPVLTVVLGPGDELLVQHLRRQWDEAVLPIRIAARAAEGMGHSLAAGVAANPRSRGWVILLADMPFVSPQSIRAVCAGLRPEGMARPAYRGVAGHPVAFAGDYFGELCRACDDRGGRDILCRHPQAVLQIEVADPGVCRDIDTVGDMPGTEKQE